jgi:hypothetical protein
MWLTTQHGFFSVVQDKADATKLQVRSRERRDLENFGNLVGWSSEETAREIIETRGADYQWRIVVSREVVARFQQQALEQVTYPNFKSRIAALPDQRHKSHALHDVWDAMAALQQCAPYSTRPRTS